MSHLDNHASQAPIFIVGFGRSGTTLLQSLLTSHPNITLAPETHFLNRWCRRYPWLDLSRPADFDFFWMAIAANKRFAPMELDFPTLRAGFEEEGADRSYRGVFTAIMKAFAELRGKPRWGEKTPEHRHHVQTLLDWYPDARIIYMMRDPRASVASWIRMTERPRDVYEFADGWCDALRIYEKHEHDERVFRVRYEDLVLDANGWLPKICDHVGERYDDAMVHRRDRGNIPVDAYSGFMREHMEATLKPINTDALTKWKKKLASDDVSLVETLCASGMARYGYDREAPDVSSGKLMFEKMRHHAKASRKEGVRRVSKELQRRLHDRGVYIHRDLQPY